jgi:hypothetical protein
VPNEKLQFRILFRDSLSRIVDLELLSPPVSSGRLSDRAFTSHSISRPMGECLLTGWR